ncbi:MAG: cupin protein [Chitinophagaceae bacterium]|nr:cupin protein [Chitinophagaceae bacterium]
MQQNENGKTVIIERSTGNDGYEGMDKAEAQIIVELIEYIPNSVLSKTIMKKTTGNVTVVSFDTGEALTEKISPFDTFIQIIEGNAEIIIDKKSNALECGQGIIIPAHSSHVVKANGRFKMTQTVIKSGYE